MRCCIKCSWRLLCDTLSTNVMRWPNVWPFEMVGARLPFVWRKRMTITSKLRCAISDFVHGLIAHGDSMKHGIGVCACPVATLQRKTMHFSLVPRGSPVCNVSVSPNADVRHTLPANAVNGKERAIVYMWQWFGWSPIPPFKKLPYHANSAPAFTCNTFMLCHAATLYLTTWLDVYCVWNHV